MKVTSALEGLGCLAGDEFCTKLFFVVGIGILPRPFGKICIKKGIIMYSINRCVNVQQGILVLFGQPKPSKITYQDWQLGHQNILGRIHSRYLTMFTST